MFLLRGGSGGWKDNASAFDVCIVSEADSLLGQMGPETLVSNDLPMLSTTHLFQPPVGSLPHYFETLCDEQLFPFVDECGPDWAGKLEWLHAHVSLICTE